MTDPYSKTASVLNHIRRIDVTKHIDIKMLIKKSAGFRPLFYYLTSIPISLGASLFFLLTLI